MAENLMNSEHKATNDNYRKGYDLAFKCTDHKWGESYISSDKKYSTQLCEKCGHVRITDNA